MVDIVIRRKPAEERMQRFRGLAAEPFTPATDLTEANAILREHHRALRFLAREIVKMKSGEELE